MFMLGGRRSATEWWDGISLCPCGKPASGRGAGMGDPRVSESAETCPQFSSLARPALPCCGSCDGGTGARSFRTVGIYIRYRHILVSLRQACERPRPSIIEMHYEFNNSLKVSCFLLKVEVCHLRCYMMPLSNLIMVLSVKPRPSPASLSSDEPFPFDSSGNFAAVQCMD